MAAPKSSRVSWILALSIAAVALYFSLRGVDWREIGRIITHADPKFLVAAFLLASFAVFVRSYRWRILLNAEDKLPVMTVFWALAVGYLGNSVLPARAGELLRTKMLSDRSRLSWSYVLATALAGMAMDMIVLVVLSAFVIVTLPGTPDWLKKGSGTMAVFGLVSMAVLVVLPRCEALVQQLLGKIPGPGGLREKITGMGSQFLLGLRAFHHPSRFFSFAGISFSVWFVDAYGTTLIGHALHITIPFEVGILLLTALAMASAAPSTPGYVGVFQFVAVAVLPNFGISKSDALAFILVFQGLSYAVFVSWGLLGLWRLNRTPLVSAPNATEATAVPAPEVPQTSN